MQPTSAYGGYGSVKKIGVNIQDVIYGGYGSYGSVNSISSQEKKEITRNPRRRKKKEKKRKSKPKAPSSEPDIFEEIELQETLDSQMNSCPLPEETKDIQEAREIQDNDEALSQSELQIEKNQGLDGDSHVSNEFPETESIESQESEAVHTINRENEQSKTKFKKAKEALAAKRQSLRLERSASQSPKKEEEKAIQTESNEASPSIDPQNSDQVGTSEPKVEQIQPDDSPVETKTSHLPKEADRNPQYPNRLAQRKPSNAIATHEESQESDDDSQYDEESDDDESDDDESDSEDSYETDSEDEIFNRKSYVTQRKAPVYSHAQEQVNNQIVQQSLQQKQQLRIQEQQIQQLKDDKQQLLEEIQEQHRQLEEVMSQHQGQKNLQRQLIEASNTISELERLKNREKKHSEDLEKQVEELKSKIEEINEQFNSYRRRAQALIEQNETSYGIEGIAVDLKFLCSYSFLADS